MSEAIFIAGLTESYNGKTVVAHLSLSVPSSTVFGLVYTILAIRFFRWE